MSAQLDSLLDSGRLAECRRYDPPVDIEEKATDVLRSIPEGVTAWLDKSCEGARQPVTVAGRDTCGKSIPQLVAMWFNGDNAQVLAATQALREHYDLEFSAEHRDEVGRQMVLHGLVGESA